MVEKNQTGFETSEISGQLTTRTFLPFHAVALLALACKLRRGTIGKKNQEWKWRCQKQHLFTRSRETYEGRVLQIVRICSNVPASSLSWNLPNVSKCPVRYCSVEGICKLQIGSMVQHLCELGAAMAMGASRTGLGRLTGLPHSNMVAEDRQTHSVYGARWYAVTICHMFSQLINVIFIWLFSIHSIYIYMCVIYMIYDDICKCIYIYIHTNTS